MSSRRMVAVKIIKKGDKPPFASTVAEASLCLPNPKPSFTIHLVFCKHSVPIIVPEINEALNLRLRHPLRPYLKAVTLCKFVGQHSGNILSYRLLVGPRRGAEVADTDSLYGFANKSG